MGPCHRRGFVEDIDEFARAIDIGPSDGWLVMERISEAAVKRRLAELLGEDAPKDWGGEQSDLHSSRVHLRGGRGTAAFLLKGAGGSFRPMKLNHLGQEQRPDRAALKVSRPLESAPLAPAENAPPCRGGRPRSEARITTTRNPAVGRCQLSERWPPTCDCSHTGGEATAATRVLARSGEAAPGKALVKTGASVPQPDEADGASRLVLYGRGAEGPGHEFGGRRTSSASGQRATPSFRSRFRHRQRRCRHPEQREYQSRRFRRTSRLPEAAGCCVRVRAEAPALRAELFFRSSVA